MYTQLSPWEREQIGLRQASWVSVPTIATIINKNVQKWENGHINAIALPL